MLISKHEALSVPNTAYVRPSDICRIIVSVSQRIFFSMASIITYQWIVIDL